MDIIKDILNEIDLAIWIKYDKDTLFFNNEFKSLINIKKYDDSYEEITKNNSSINRLIYTIENIDKNTSYSFSLNGKLYKHSAFYIDKLKLMAGVLVEISDIEKFSNISNLQHDKHILRTVIDNIPELIFYKDKNLKYIGLNKHCKEFYENLGVKNVIGKGDLELPLDKNFINQCYEHDKVVISTKEPLYIEETVESSIFQTIKTPIIGEDGSIEGLVGIVRDITDYKNNENNLKYLSYTDVLTGLYNRAYFDKKVQEMIINKNFPVGLILGDVNGLKLVNDTLGHLEGDRLLRIISDILTKSSNGRGIVFRWGGDEFVILLPNSSDIDCSNVMNKIHDLCNVKDYDNITLSISLGYSILDKGDSIDSVLAEAEDKVYRQKMLSNSEVRKSMLENLKNNLEIKNVETERHTERVSKYCEKIAKALNLSDEMIEKSILIGKLHDIGKIGIPEHILLKPEKLNDEEYEIMKTHSEKGYRVANLIPEINHMAREILTHHERWDGNGYPLGLKGYEIPILSRIVAVADSFDAMTNDRPYSKGIDKNKAIKEIEINSGKQFDPEVVKAFLNIMKNEDLENEL